jgi:hypothetical protein
MQRTPFGKLIGSRQRTNANLCRLRDTPEGLSRGNDMDRKCLAAAQGRARSHISRRTRRLRNRMERSADHGGVLRWDSSAGRRPRIPAMHEGLGPGGRNLRSAGRRGAHPSNRRNQIRLRNRDGRIHRNDRGAGIGRRHRDRFSGQDHRIRSGRRRPDGRHRLSIKLCRACGVGICRIGTGENRLRRRLRCRRLRIRW